MIASSEIPQELSRVLPPLTKRPDFDEFWKRTIQQKKQVLLKPTKKVYDFASPYVKVYNITYQGFDETPIHGIFMVPTFLSQKKFPCVINYHGFGGNCGYPSDFFSWAMMGMASLSVDCRDQSGQTGDRTWYSNGAMNVVAKGVLNKEEYYFRAVYMDCVKAIDFACDQAEVDSTQIIINGGSQGGGLGSAVCMLDDRPILAMLDVPSNSWIEKRIEGEHGVFSEVTTYLKSHPDQIEKVYETMSYFDTMNMADKMQCTVLACVGLKDNVCPAECYFATYNRITSSKTVRIYPFNGHEGGGAFHHEIKLQFLRELIP